MYLIVGFMIEGSPIHKLLVKRGDIVIFLSMLKILCYIPNPLFYLVGNLVALVDKMDRALLI